MAEQMRSADLLVKTAISSKETLDALKINPEETLKKLGAEAVEHLPRILDQPDPPIRNIIWLVVVIGFVLVMVGAAWVLGSGVGTELKKDVVYATKSETILTVFSTVVAFLAGLLSPSPMGKKGT